MARTLHRPPVGGETPDDLDFLEGIDLHGVHQRERDRTSAMTKALLFVGALAVLAVLGALLATVLFRGAEPGADTYPDSGHRPMTYDLETPTDARDSWAAAALADHDAVLRVTHDSRIEQSIAAWRTELADVHDSRIDLLLAG